MGITPDPPKDTDLNAKGRISLGLNPGPTILCLIPPLAQKYKEERDLLPCWRGKQGTAVTLNTSGISVLESSTVRAGRDPKGSVIHTFLSQKE